MDYHWVQSAPPPPSNISLMYVCSVRRPAGASRRGPHRTGRASEVRISCCTDVVCPVTGSPGAGKTCAYRWRRFIGNSRPASPREGWDPVTMLSMWCGRAPLSSPDGTGSARATKTANTGTKFPTHEKEGRTITTALGFTIRTLADHDAASTSVYPTRTP